MKYRFYLNQQQDAEGRLIGFLGYSQGHALELVHSGQIEADSPRTACEMLFELFNIHHPRDYRNRSMSVGDVVVIETETVNTFACDWVGFKTIENVEGGTK
jgi:hypothetical protein